MKKVVPILLFTLLFTVAKSQYVEKVTSINYYGYNGLNPSNISVFNNKLYFFGTDDLHYVDKLMYTADGSAAGVTVVKQIDTVKQWPTLRHLTMMNNLLVFDNYNELWKSDGTTAGTSMIKTIEVSAANYVVLNNKAYFAGDITNANPINDQLWQTDGTASGTTLVKTINPSGPAGIVNMFVYGGKIYFNASDATHSSQLWVSDGTTSGTMLLKLINPTGIAYPSNFIAYNGKVYFSADDGVNGNQLWVTDGTPVGTVKITNINAGSAGFQPRTMTLFNSKIYFCGIDTGSFYQLFSTDGTAIGTKKIKTDYTPRNGVRGFYPSSMAVHNGILYMAAYDSLTMNDQLWSCDGTTAGTLRITSFTQGLYPSRLYSFQNWLVMTGNDTITHSVQLYASDGTAAGTVCPTPPDTWSTYPFYPWEAWVPFNNALYFKGAYTYFADYQLCRFSSTPSGIEQPIKNNLSVYPNPSSGLVHIMLAESATNAKVEVFNSNGQLILSKNINHAIQTTLDLTNHAKGLYVIKIQSGDNVLMNKVVIE